MKLFKSLIFSFLVFYSLSAQFVKVLGGSSDEYARKIIATTDGGYVIVGETYSSGAGNSDIFIIKLDSNFLINWAKTLGGVDYDYAYSVLETSDSGYVITGWTASIDPNSDYALLAKFSFAGSLLWCVAFGGSFNDRAYSVVETADSGFIVVGETQSARSAIQDGFFAKFDASGNLQWANYIGESFPAKIDLVRDIVKTSDGGYALTGWTGASGAGSQDAFILKFDSGWNLSFSKTFGGADQDYAYSLIESVTGGFVFTGRTLSSGAGNYDIFIVKLSNSGNLKWANTLGGPQSDYGYEIIQTTDKGFAVAGEFFTTGGNDDLIAKFDSSGNMLWQSELSGSSNDFAYSLVQTSDGGYVITGYSLSFGDDVLLAKYNSSGVNCRGGSAGLTLNNWGTISVADWTNVIINDWNTLNSTFWTSVSVADFPVSQNEICFLGDEEELPKKNKCRNDVRPELNIVSSLVGGNIKIVFGKYLDYPLTVKIFNINGTLVFKKFYPSVPGSIVINKQELKDIKKGVYFISLQMEGIMTKSFKFLKEN